MTYLISNKAFCNADKIIICWNKIAVEHVSHPKILNNRKYINSKKISSNFLNLFTFDVERKENKCYINLNLKKYGEFYVLMSKKCLKK